MQLHAAMQCSNLLNRILPNTIPCSIQLIKGLPLNFKQIIFCIMLLPLLSSQNPRSFRGCSWHPRNFRSESQVLNFQLHNLAYYLLLPNLIIKSKILLKKIQIITPRILDMFVIRYFYCIWYNIRYNR